MASPAHARTKIEVTSGHLNPLPIALPAFKAEADMAALGKDILGVVAADLERSGLFDPLDRKTYIEETMAVNAIPRFSDWKKIDAQALVTGTLKQEPGGTISVEFRVWDTAAGKQVLGKQFGGYKNTWRRIAHLVADEIYKRLTGEGGYFDSRIVYIAETGSKRNPVKRLAIMDQDGANRQYLTPGKVLTLTPRFDTNSQKIIYMAYHGNQPNVYLYDLSSGKEDLLGRFDGMSYAPRFSPDGTKVVMAVSLDGNSEIFAMDMRSRTQYRLTRNDAIDTSPSYSPDGKSIVFNSDRDGKPQIYVMNAEGGNVRRISKGDGSYTAPVWSPKDNDIAFIKQQGGKFHLGVMNSDGGSERLLTTSYLDEGPTWSPNGRVLMFARETGPGKGSKLYSADISGYNIRPVSTPTLASDPAWSPLLK